MMKHMADPKDKAQAKLRQVQVKVGQRYRHYKDPHGAEYEIVALAIQEDTLEPLVIYYSQKKRTIWARTLKNWNESVVINGKRVKRFQLITSVSG